TLLINQICSYFQKSSLSEILPCIYGAKNVKKQIASLSKLVINAADNGDRTANHIIENHGRFIGESIACIIEKLFKERSKTTDIPVVLVGGLFKRIDLFIPFIKKVLYEKQLNAKF